MFAKLKKKIENEDGARISSPRRSESVTSLTGITPAGNTPSFYGRDTGSPSASVTSEDPAMRDVTSARDDLAAVLQKKSDQCRKLEGNISDLAALIKDKNKTIEKLESSLKQQDEVLSKKLQEQKEEFEAYRDKLIEGYQVDKLKLDQLLNTESELAKCRSELESKTRQCQTAETQVEKLTDELGPLRQQFTALESDGHRLKEENSERAELITKLSKEKSAFDKRLDELNRELSERQSQCNNLQARLADGEESHKTLARNSDLQNNKNTKALREKDELIDTLNERVATLEQRIADSSLSGDDRATALEAERKQMELKLTEARQQLTEIKSTWSDKITQLEEQISHLNTKIVEDGEELSTHNKMAEQMKEGFEKQIEGLKTQLEDAEKRALENFELAASKDSLYEKQLLEKESQLEGELVEAKDAEKVLRAECGRLRKELEELRDVTTKKEDETKDRITQLERQETESQVQLKAMELKIQVIETSLHQREDELNSYKKKLEEKESSGLSQDSTITSLQRQVQELEINVEKAMKERTEFENHLRTSENDKGDLLEKNADLYRQMESLKTSESECRQEHQRTLTLKSACDANVQKTEALLRQKIHALESQIEMSELSKAESGLYSSRIDEMGETISTLENQLADKTRVVKKQEQMLKDLRQTLQRELKVQALPGDDNSGGGGEPNYNASHSSSSPSSNRRAVDNYHQKPSDLSSSLSSSLHSSISPPSLSSSSSSNRLPSSSTHYQHNSSSNNSSSHSNNHYQQQQQHPPPFHKVGGSHNHHNNQPLPAVLPLDSASSPNYYMLTSSSSSVPSGAGTDSLTVHTNNVKRELEKDVNFQYLKHVVLKFMLSREVEALQLIKAVSMLLNFSNHEQQLMRETLEWKMSWFGSRPPPGRGQTSKK